MTLRKFLLIIGVLASVVALNAPVPRADAALPGRSDGATSSSPPYDGSLTDRGCIQDWEEVPEGPECVLVTEADAQTGRVRAGYSVAGRTDAAWARSVVSESVGAGTGGAPRQFTTVVDVEAGNKGSVFVLLVDEDGRWLGAASEQLGADAVRGPIVLTAEEPAAEAGRTAQVHVGVGVSYFAWHVGTWVEQPYELCAPGYWMGVAPCIYGLPTLVPPTFVGSPVNLPGTSPVALVEATVRSIAIAQPPPPPRLSVADAVAGEGDDLEFLVTLSAPPGADGSATVEYTTEPPTGTATRDDDYRSTTESVTFGPGETQQVASVPTTDDDLVEDAETFTLSLSKPQTCCTGDGAFDYVIEDGTAAGRITDNDEPPDMAVADAEVREGRGSVCVLSVSLSAPSTQRIEVLYATATHTARRHDFRRTSGALTFAPGAKTQEIEVNVRDDRRDERKEKFLVRLSDLTPEDTAVLVDSTGVCLIHDND